MHSLGVFFCFFFFYLLSWTSHLKNEIKNSSHLAFVIQTLYSDIHRIDHYPVGKYWKTNNNCNHNLHVVITHASHVCSQHSFQPPQRINGMHRMQLHRMQCDHAHFKLLPLVVTHVLTIRWVKPAQCWSKIWSLSRALFNLWLLLVFYRPLDRDLSNG